MEVLIIILFNIVVFYRTLKFSIIVDDIKQYTTIQKRETNEWKNTPKEILRRIQFRLYGGATFGVNHPRIDHAFTILLHTCICILIYMVFGYNNISFITALLYSCNPVNTQTSIWFNGRRYAITVIIVLLMMFYAPWGIVLYPLTFINYQVIGLFSPMLIKGLSPYLLIIIPVFLTLNWKKISKKIKHRMNHILCKDQRHFKPSRFIIIIKSFGFYFFNIIAPIRIMMNYPNLYYWGINPKDNAECYKINYEFFKGIIACIIAILGIFYFKEYLLIMWVFMFLAMLQWSAILSAVQVNSDRYMCLANVFMMYFLSYTLYNLPYNMITIPCLIVYYLCQLSVVMIMYQSLDHYQKYQMFFAPYITKPRFNRIEFYLHKGRFLTAWYLIEEGLQNMPKDFNLLVQAATCAFNLGNKKQGNELLDLASKNFYLGQEEHQSKHLAGIRERIKSIETKSEKLMRQKGRRV